MSLPIAELGDPLEVSGCTFSMALEVTYNHVCKGTLSAWLYKWIPLQCDKEAAMSDQVVYTLLWPVSIYWVVDIIQK